MNYSANLRGLLFLLAFPIFLAGCRRSPEPPPIPEPTPPPTSVEAATPSPTATPAVASTPPPTAVETSAPAKNVYLKRRVSVTHDAGIFGFPPGTRVEIVERKGDMFTASVKGVQFEVAVAETTENPDELPSVVPPGPAGIAQPAPAGQPKVVPPPPATNAKAAARAVRDQQIFQLRQEIANLQARRREIYDQLRQMKNPDRTPEGKARKAQIRQIGLTIDQHYLQIRQLSR